MITSQPDQKQTSTDLHCYHCGEPCKETTIHLEEKAFCCDGCKLVYEILNENNLCSYYDVAQSSGNSPDSSVYSGKFNYLTQPEILRQLLHFNSETQHHVKLFVPGIHCSSCIWLLENMQKLDGGVISSSVNFPRREVTIVYNPSKTDLSKIATRMASIGYEPHISLGDIDKKQRRKADRSQWLKIGIAGFSFGNIMMMSFPEYFSIGELAGQESLQQTFIWLNFALSLPVLLYSAQEFFISGVSALRNKHLNIDLPIAAAVLMTFLRSVYEITSGTGAGYFDSMTGIVFFMLIGRAFQNRTYETLSFDRDYKSYFPVAVSVIMPDGSEDQITVSNLKKGMRMRIRNQEVVPADAILLRGDARIDYSFVTGESDPEKKVSGDIVYAGGRQTGASIELEIVKPVKYSYLTQLWNHAAFRKDDAEAEQASMVNKINQYFTLGLFIIAASTAYYWWNAGETVRMMDAVTTILIVACPCILLLAATFTNGNVLSILGKNGLYLKNAFVIEKLAEANAIVFDKTGTITLNRSAAIRFVGDEIPSNFRQAIYSLASQSTHPLSLLIAASFKGIQTKPVTDFTDVTGAGLLGKADGFFVRIGSAAFLGIKTENPFNDTRVYISIDGEILGYYSFDHALRPGLSSLVSKLKERFKLFLLSGDKESDKDRLSTYFSSDAMHFHQQPSDKLQFVANLQQQGNKVLMVGDGLNDAGALRQSDAGIAVSDDVNNFSPACDAILDGKVLPKLASMLQYCRDGKRVIAVSFALSLLYNVVGLYFSVRGELEPVIAAILMPITSISIVSFATITSSLLARRRGL